MNPRQTKVLIRRIKECPTSGPCFTGSHYSPPTVPVMLRQASIMQTFREICSSLSRQFRPLARSVTRNLLTGWNRPGLHLHRRTLPEQSIRNKVAFLIHSHHDNRTEEHTSELQSLMRNSYAVFSLIKKK